MDPVGSCMVLPTTKRVFDVNFGKLTFSQSILSELVSFSPIVAAHLVANLVGGMGSLNEN